MKTFRRYEQNPLLPPTMCRACVNGAHEYSCLSLTNLKALHRLLFSQYTDTCLHVFLGRGGFYCIYCIYMFTCICNMVILTNGHFTYLGFKLCFLKCPCVLNDVDMLTGTHTVTWDVTCIPSECINGVMSLLLLYFCI